MSQDTRRAVKALKLMMALEAESRTLMSVGTHRLDPETEEGAQALADWSREMMPEYAWCRLAKRVGVNPPSARTIRLVVSMFQAKAEYLGSQEAPESAARVAGGRS